MEEIQRVFILAAIISFNGILFREYLIGKWNANPKKYSLPRRLIQKILQYAYGVLFLPIAYTPLVLPGILVDLSNNQEGLKTGLLYFNLIGNIVYLGFIFFSTKKKLRINFGEKVFGREF